MLAAIRIWLPIAIAIAGVVLIIVGGGETLGGVFGSSIAGGGVGLIIVALIVWMVNWMFRMSVESNRDREREEQARDYFEEHGHWPDEEDGDE